MRRDPFNDFVCLLGIIGSPIALVIGLFIAFHH